MFSFYFEVVDESGSGHICDKYNSLFVSNIRYFIGVDYDGEGAFNQCEHIDNQRARISTTYENILSA